MALMRISTMQRLAFVLLACAGVMIFPGLLRPAARADLATRPASEAAARSPFTIHLRRGLIDTRARRDLDTAAQDISTPRAPLGAQRRAATAELRLVQFAGPIKRRWLDRLNEAGAEIVGYAPDYAYLIRGTPAQLARVALLDAGEMSDDARPLRWMGRLEPLQKLDPAFSEERLAAHDPARLDVEIELLDGADVEQTINGIISRATAVVREPRRFLKYVVLTVNLPADQLLDVAESSDVLFISPARPFKTHDERSAQIIAANLTADGTQPAAPGYLNWLAAKGLNTPPDFVIDVTDTGLDSGSTTDLSVHPDFRDADDHSRVVYSFNYANDGQTDDRRGHGTLVASIAAGLGASDREDASGYRLGTGVDPLARIGASRIFNTMGSTWTRLSFTSVAAAAYGAGARISNNSWGNGGNAYDATAQEYDALTRDAQPATPGNQEMVFVFAAGNDGPGGHISSPGSAKNVITVAASENYRPEGTDSCNLDGQGAIGPDGADNALDILRYSSGGPTADGRLKPDLTAPGTHVYGAASRAPLFNGVGLCPGVPIYQPPGQQFYTWSSGTSLATPHVTGAASLVRRYFTSHNLLGAGLPPSPAMTKAFLVNSATYMTGANAGESLPGERQGYGLVNLTRATDATPRQYIDQSVRFTESGQSYEVNGSLADRSQPLRVTLCWTDAVGALIGPALVNDLDLEVQVGDAVVFRGNHFEGSVSMAGGDADRANNVEAIIIPASAIPEGVAGNFRVVVRAANLAGDGVPGNDSLVDQDFALVVANIAAPLVQPPPEKKVPVITAATYVKKTITITGHDFTAAAKIEINGKVIDQPFAFDAATNSFSLRMKAKKLNLTGDTDNKIVLIENGERSQPFTLRF
ncbi:MAG TPA: S8 family serine peptidase [Blastocatellia bacterium]|nr:S8 family serine peptidase [Blastocatellia bacterium]